MPAPHPLAGTMLAAHGIAATRRSSPSPSSATSTCGPDGASPQLRSAAFWLCAMIAVLALTGLGFYYVAAEEA